MQISCRLQKWNWKLSRLAGLARNNKLKPQHFQDGTFTVSNGGVFGSLLSTPILNPPQVGILGMHSIQQRPVNVNGKCGDPSDDVFGFVL